MNAHQKSPVVARKSTRRSMAGVTLIETLVGVALGLLVVLVITQVWGVFEGQRGRTASGSTAQETGLIALTQLEQSIHNAGAGMNSGLSQCVQLFSIYNTSGNNYVAPAPGYPSPIAGTKPLFSPVVIIDGGTTGSDKIQITRGTDMGGALDSTVSKTDPAVNAEVDLLNVKNFTQVPTPCSAQDSQEHLIVCRHHATNQCILSQVTNVQAASLKLNMNKGQCAPYNPSATCFGAGGLCAQWPTLVTNDTCFSIGSLIKETYYVFNNELRVDTIVGGGIPDTTTILADNIVSLQAQYGVAPAGSQQVNCWTNATSNALSTCGADDWTPANSTPAKVNRIKAVRVVVVVRSPKLEAGGTVTGICTTAGGVANNGPCAWTDSASNKAPLIDLSGDANWQRYRYRPYQTIIPLRNVIWANI